MRVGVRQSRFWLFLGLIGVLAGASLFAVGGSAESGSSASPEASPAASPFASPMASPIASPVASPEVSSEIVIDIAMIAFQTAMIEIPAGTTVTWVNKDVVAHTVTHTPATGDVIFDSGYFQSGESWSYTFDEVGTFDYYCIPHPNMIGTVVVVEP